MGRTEYKEGTYYSRTREERRAYQNAYYQRTKVTQARQREIARELNPEAHAAALAKHREYYRNNRDQMLAKRKERYRRSKLESQKQG